VRASLAAATPRARPAARTLLDPRGARVVLGARPTLPAAPIVPAADTLFGPRGVCVAGIGGPLFVCDTGHHRVLAWTAMPDTDDTPADLVIGQRDFRTEGRNAGREPGAATLHVPTGIAVSGDVLAVADAWNHRVLLWHGLPRRLAQPADVVLGQAGFEGALPNRGAAAPRADSLHWPYGLCFHGGRLYVADTGNRRVLGWDGIPTAHGRAADVVLDSALRWPHGLAAAGGRILIADAGAKCVWRWDPSRGDPPAALAREANMPYGVAVAGDTLLVADTADSRILGFAPDGARAWGLAGQRHFSDRGDNRWSFPARDSVCWPYGLASCGGVLAVADSGNNRVMLWDLA